MKNVEELLVYCSIEGIISNILLGDPMVDKRKSLPKCPYQCRRSRRSTPELLFPYLPGPELFVSPPTSTVQTMPVYSTSRSSSNLDNASPFITGYAPFTDSIAPPDLSLVPSNSGLSYTESDVVEDLLIRLTTQSVFPPRMDWYGPTGAQYLLHGSRSI